MTCLFKKIFHTLSIALILSPLLSNAQCECGCYNPDDTFDKKSTLDDNEQVGNEENPNTNKPMVQRAREKGLNVLADILQALQDGKKVDLNAKDKKTGNTPLHFAAWIDDLEMVKL